MNAPTALIPRATVSDIVAQRNRALTLYRLAHDALAAASAALVEAAKAAQQSAREVSRFNFHSADDRRKFLGHLDVPEREAFMTEARRLTDTDVWSHIVAITDLQRLMDKTAKDQFTQQLITDPPEVTVDNIAATLEQFAADAGTIWRRGIAEAFSKLDRRFRSHDGWKIGSRIVLTYCFDTYGSWSFRGNVRDTMQDIERVFMVLDGRPIPQVHAGIVGVVETSRQGQGYGPRQSVAESEFFRVRGFKNGNAHIWFKRDDLVDRVNQLLGEYYGAPIPEDREPDADTGLHDPKTTLAKNYGFFPTPQAATDLLINGVPLYDRNGRTFTVLEPSAGTGNLLRALTAKGAIVDAVEVHPERAAELRRSRAARRVRQCDFLQLEPSELYDRVVMNPPFDRERDVDHVVHALRFLKPDGFLTAIMSAGTEFRETRKAVAFRDLMTKMNASWRDLPPGSFSSVGTHCNTVIVRVWNDGRRCW